MRSPLARLILPLMLAGLLVAGCDSADVTEGPVTSVAESADARPNQSGLLTNLEFTGTVADGEFAGETVEGLLTITELGLNEDGELVATGTALVGGVLTAFTDLLVNLTGDQQSCRILFLEIPGGIFLDVLGLVVDIQPIELEIRAERGPGNLLGNLLCAVVGLLDGGGPLAAIGNLLNQINNLLG
jgi:hypothetical protein